MHEVALSQQLAAAAHRAAGGRQVTAVHIDVGDLRQVVCESLTYAWSFVTKDTDLAGAELHINRVSAVLQCRHCATRSPIDRLGGLECRHCHSRDIDVVRGDEFRLRAIDVCDTKESNDGTLPSSR